MLISKRLKNSSNLKNVLLNFWGFSNWYGNMCDDVAFNFIRIVFIYKIFNIKKILVKDNRPLTKRKAARSRKEW